ncbi:uncharacterized protein [Leptinotarsa decemlineata]|uniref:uncharacterized protein n=1 Tax=Leptinotarsa decemlineata TaxID=7539 RepID=UPI003D30B371
MAQFVKNKNAEEFSSKFTEAARAIIDKHYVDDYLDSAETEEEAIQLILEVIKIHDEAGFEIRNWISNSQEVTDKIPVNLRSPNQKNFSTFTHKPERVLRLWWNPEADTFTFSLNH